MKKKLTVVILLAAVAGVLCFILLKPSSTEKFSLETAALEKMSISSVVMATGTVEPVTEVEVGTQVSGIISKLYVDYNDVVKAGQLIAEMDKETLEAELASAEAELASCKNEYEYQQKTYERNKVLYDKKLISDYEYDTALYNYNRAKSEYDRSVASMVKVKRNLEYATITSPIDGIVISRAVEEGQTVAAGFETPTLFTIANDLTQMEVIADVDEADIGGVKEGQRVEFYVDAYPDDTFEGRVKQVRLEAVVESNVVTYEVVISAYNPELKLKPGLTANISIYTMEKNDADVIPSRALRYVPDPESLSAMGISMSQGNMPAAGNMEESNSYVWVLKNGTITHRTVKTGDSSGDMTEIISGLVEGDTVVVGMKADVKLPSDIGEIERSPFMPAPPGGGNGKNGK